MFFTKNNLRFLQLFSKLANIIVAIELLASLINAEFHFYCSRELSVFGLKKKENPYVNRIDF